MKQPCRFRLAAAARSALRLVLCGCTFTACGGNAFSGGAGDAAVGGAIAAGGQPEGGAVAMGGSQNAGGAPSTGGSAGAPSATGGTSSACSVASDCTDCAYTKAPGDATACYCANCALTPMSKTQCVANQNAWSAVCANVRMACPAIACIAPAPPACVSGVCTASSSATTN